VIYYRIRQLRNGKYVAQIKFLFFWANLFCGSHSDLPDQFDTIDAAEKRIRETHPLRIQHRECVVKEFVL